MSVWLGNMTLDQVDSLEPIFAELTPSGWVIPAWLIELRACVEQRDAAQQKDEQ